MKRLILILLLLTLGTLSYSQAFIDDVFNKYSGKQGFTSVVLTPQLFKILSLVDKEDNDLKMLSEKVKSLKILVSEDKKIGFTEEIKNKMGKDNYLNIMEIIDGNQKVNFYVKQNADVITDFLLLSIDDSEEVLISITGNLNMNDLSKIGNSSKLDKNNSHVSLLKNLEMK
jgi:hypothetical protein